MSKSVKEMLAGMLSWFQGILKMLPKWVEAKMPDIFKFTNAVRSALEKGEEWLKSQTADTIVAIIPGNLDDSIRRNLILAFETAIPIVAKISEAEQTFGEKLLAYLNHLHQNETDYSAKKSLQDLSATMLKLTDDHKLHANNYDSLAQLAWSKFGLEPESMPSPVSGPMV